MALLLPLVVAPVSFAGPAFIAQHPAQAKPEAQAFVAGQRVDRVTSQYDPAEELLVYVPSSYDPARPAPVLFLLDARGRARIPADLFKAAAEQFGYILFSSYNSASDGPAEPNVKAMRAMWQDSHAWFNIDDRRVYAAGFSGTVRVSCLMANASPGLITGVIGAGAGFPPGMAPKRSTPFLFYGTVGDTDFNYWEMLDLDGKMADVGLAHRIETFFGPHGWMPSELALEAVEWMEIQAMKAGSRRTDQALVEVLWNKQLAGARELERADRILDAAARYTASARDFEGLHDTGEAGRNGMALAQSKLGRQQAKQRRDERARWTRFLRDAASALAFPSDQDILPSQIEQVVDQLHIANLKADARKPETEAGSAARRILAMVDAQVGFYLPRQALDQKDYSRAAYYLAIAHEINARAAMPWYLDAVVRACQGDKRKAIEALQHAAQLGLGDPGLLENEDAFVGLRGETGYQIALSRVKQNSAGRSGPGRRRDEQRRFSFSR